MNKVQDRLEERLQSEILTEDMAAYTLEFFENEFQHRPSPLQNERDQLQAEAERTRLRLSNLSILYDLLMG